MNTTAVIEKINTGALDARFVALYGKEALTAQRARYIKAIEEFAALYGAERDVYLLSVAGRSELAGNHTDHNRGAVIACELAASRDG